MAQQLRRACVSLTALTLVTGLACLPAIAASPAYAANPPAYADLRADNNRDGTVDLMGFTDESVEDTGRALVLPNLDDDAGRCPKATGKGVFNYPTHPKTRQLMKRIDRAEQAGKPVPKTKPGDFPKPTQAQMAQFFAVDERLDACHDAADEVVNGDLDAADLAVVASTPQPSLPSGATGTLTVNNDKFRVFWHVGTGWQPVAAATVFSSDQLRVGLRLAVEAKDIARDAALWDGTGQLTLRVTTPGAGSTPAMTTTDTVQLAVAPLLTNHHLQRAELLMAFWSDKGKEQQRFVRDLTSGAKKAAVRGGVHRMKAPENWQQDIQEPGYVSIPTPNGSQAIRLIVRSDQNRTGQRELYDFRGPGTGVIWMGSRPKNDDSTYDSMGNLETIPPYVYAGRAYPAGRIVLGEDPGKLTPLARMRALWAAQGQQPGGLQQPLLLDTGWLEVGHVDEILSFVPADTPRGWRLVLADPMAGIDLLRKAKAAGRGAAVISTMWPTITVDKALEKGKAGTLDVNIFAAKKIDENLDRIKAATGITAAEIVRVPVLNLGKYRKDGRVSEVSSLVPNAVNSPMVNGYVLAPKQHSVVAKGRDIFADAVRRAYASAGMKTYFVEDLLTQHAGGGEVHCGSNTFRDITQPWWK